MMNPTKAMIIVVVDLLLIILLLLDLFIFKNGYIFLICFGLLAFLTVYLYIKDLEWEMFDSLRSDYITDQMVDNYIALYNELGSGK